MNTSGGRDDHRSWKKTQEHNLYPARSQGPYFYNALPTASLLGQSHVGTVADKSSPHRKNKGRNRGRESASDRTRCLCTFSLTTFAPPGKQGSGEKRQPPEITSMSEAQLRLPTLPPGPQLPSAFGSTTQQGVGFWEGLVSLHQQHSLLTDGLFSFNGGRAFQRIMPHRTAASSLEPRPPVVHSKCVFAYHRLTDPRPGLPLPTQLPIPKGKTAGLEAVQRLGIGQCGPRLPEQYRKEREGMGLLDGTNAGI